jgi:hypothetical protein
LEQVYSKPGLPALGNTVGPELLQVVRRVVQVCDRQEIYFDGDKVVGGLSFMQILLDFFSVGKKITTKPMGESQFVLQYAGFHNVVRPLPQMGNMLPEAWTKLYKLKPPSLFIYGHDPIPHITLYQNPRVVFEAPGGDGPPSALAIFDKNKNMLMLPTLAERAQLLQKLAHQVQVP